MNKYKHQLTQRPGAPKSRELMVIMCTPSSIQRLTSNKRSADKVMMSQQIAITTKEGKNPLTPVATGKASIPPPIQVPATKNVAEISRPTGRELFTTAT